MGSHCFLFCLSSVVLLSQYSSPSSELFPKAFCNFGSALFRIPHAATERPTNKVQVHGLAKDVSVVENFDEAGVLQWVKAELEAAGYKPKVVTKVTNILSKEEVIGSALLKLTVERLMQVGIPLGPAETLGGQIQSLQAAKDEETSELEKNFAQALENAHLEEDMLKIPAGSTGSFKWREATELWDEKTFYVRKPYKDIADIMFKDKPPTMSLLGSSGIGKSNFIVYLMWLRFNDPELCKFPIFLHDKNSIIKYQKGKTPIKVSGDDVFRAEKKSLYIMDSHIDVEQSAHCQTLWVTSARKPEEPSGKTEHFKIAERVEGQFFMPPWTLEEMLNKEVKKLHKISPNIVRDRFGLFGGTARLVLEANPSRFLRNLKRLNEALRAPGALGCLDVPSDLKAVSQKTHLLLKIHPQNNSNFRSFDVELSSPYVCQELVKRNRQKHSAQLWEKIEDGTITGIGFALFEQAFHEFMQDKSILNFTMRARKLGAELNDTVLEFRGALDGVLVSGNPKPVIEKGKYYQPMSKNFQAIDAWSSDGFIQITMAGIHDIKFGNHTTQASKVLDVLSKERNSPVPFYFVVPKSNFDTAWKKLQKVIPATSADKIDQWVVCFEENLP